MSLAIRHGVIAAAGQATRMWPASKAVPKEVFPLGRVPVISYLVWELHAAGIENITIVCAPHNIGLLRVLLDKSRDPPAKLAHDPITLRFQRSLQECEISLMEQAGHYGNATPLRLAADALGGLPCIYAFGDDIVIGENATQGLLSLHCRTALPVLAAQEVVSTRRSALGILECEARDGVEFVRRLLEKPRIDQTDSNLASFGRYLVTEAVIAEIRNLRPGRDGEVWFTDAITSHLSNGGQVCVHRLTTGRWYTVGDPANYADAIKAATDEQLGA